MPVCGECGEGVGLTPNNVDDIAVLIHGTPKILLLTVDPDEKFVQIPSIPETTLLFLETPSKVGSEFPAPSPDGLIPRSARRSSTSRKLKQKR